MIEVRFRRDSRERLSSFLATGHAGWADSGEDVVCAAVAAILQSALLGLTEIARIDVRATRKRGRMNVAWPEAERENAAVVAIVATAALSVERIATQYPGHVVVVYERDDG